MRNISLAFVFLAGVACGIAANSIYLTHPTVPRVVIQKGVGQAYCRSENADKEADFALVAAITEEVERESNLWLTRWWR